MILPEIVHVLEHDDALELAEILRSDGFFLFLIDPDGFVVDQLGQTLSGEPIERFALYRRQAEVELFENGFVESLEIPLVGRCPFVGKSAGGLLRLFLDDLQDG